MLYCQNWKYLRPSPPAEIAYFYAMGRGGKTLAMISNWHLVKIMH